MPLDSLVPVASPRPVVHLEWDRGHESFDAIVRLDAPEALVITEVFDLWPQAGCKWIRADEVLVAEPLDPDAPAVRVLDRLGVRMFGVDDSVADLSRLLDAAAADGTLLGVQSARTGSDEMLVGTVVGRTHDVVDLDEIDLAGRPTGEPLRFGAEEIIAVEWGTDYLRALGMLLEEARER